MKAIIKIVVALAVVISVINAGRAVWANYQFEDDVHQSLIFNPRATDAQIVDMVMKSAREFDVPMDPKEGITIRRQDPEVHVDMAYTTNIVLVPGVFGRDWTFTSTVSTRFLPGVSR